jgi:hypothetical protein
MKNVFIILLPILSNLYCHEYNKTYEIDEPSCGGIFVKFTKGKNGIVEMEELINGSNIIHRNIYYLKNGLVIRIRKETKSATDFKNDKYIWGMWELKLNISKPKKENKRFLELQKRVNNIVAKVNAAQQ